MCRVPQENTWQSYKFAECPQKTLGKICLCTDCWRVLINGRLTWQQFAKCTQQILYFATRQISFVLPSVFFTVSKFVFCTRQTTKHSATGFRQCGVRYLHYQQFNSIIFLISSETPQECPNLQHGRKIIMALFSW